MALTSEWFPLIFRLFTVFQVLSSLGTSQILSPQPPCPPWSEEWRVNCCGWWNVDSNAMCQLWTEVWGVSVKFAMVLFYLPLMFQIQISAVNLGPGVGTRQSRDPSQSAKGTSCERKSSLCVYWICLSQQPNWPILTQCWKHDFWPWGSLILKPTNNHCCGLKCANPQIHMVKT